MLIDEARKLKDIPYFFKGRSRGGLDCGGMYITILNNSNITTDYEFLNYNTNPNPNVIKRELNKLCDEVDYPILPGDFLLIKYTGLAQHIAIYTDKNTLIHTYKERGMIVEEKFTNFWRSRVDTIYRVRI